jgi:Domain of unknown function (DUF4384)
MPHRPWWQPRHPHPHPRRWPLRRHPPRHRYRCQHPRRPRRASARPQLRIGRDKLSFTIKSSRDGFVNVLLQGPDGSLLQLFPNSQSADNRIKAGQTLTLPQANWVLDTAEPAGAEHFLVIVSQHPRDYSALSTRREFYFLDLPTGESATALMAGWKHATPMLLGAPSAKADCQGGACDVFGAARFTVEVVN